MTAADHFPGNADPWLSARAQGLPREPRAVRWLRERRAQGTAGWRPTDAMARGVLVGLGFAIAGLILHQPGLLLLGAPLLVSAMLALPAFGDPVVRVHRRDRTVEEGRDDLVTVSIDPGPRAELVAIRLPLPGTTVGPVHLLPASATRLAARVRFDAWGEGVEMRPDHLIAGPDALMVFGPVVGREARRLVLPPATLMPPGPLPPRAAGLVGVHRSPRPGDGTELRDIRPFQPGDRLRRVDWRVSLRAAAAAGGELVPGTLHVRERHAEADADLVIALDTRVDVGADVEAWASQAPGGVRAGGSLDTGVRAASALAASFLRQGDRVGLVDLGSPRLGVPPGSGRRQLDRIRHQLVTCGRLAGWTARPVLRPVQAPAGALVVVLSTFLDDAIADLTAHAARRGNPIIAVDLLPHPLTPARETPWGPVVLGLLLAEQRVRLDALRGLGVPSVRWGDGTALRAMLRLIRRRRGVLA
ncbi:MAG TPA: DUF58 domain-containing protein [Actinophytocola sp.]|jgi:uncharacterized protein (DUF58 family)|uniref:DUF58 domain-containing protein n=1 Tax=Actinophytocola sp. TaxID=1872138 RepID=UPI002E02275B|nr:DUF58 domain-containing protein [Actinophytocola sp.]